MSRTSMILQTLALAAVLCTDALATPTTYYVNAATGNNGNSGLSAGSPLKTITWALTHKARTGDTIHVAAAGRYDAANGESFPLTTNKADITIIGDAVSGVLPDISAVYYNSGTSSWVSYSSWPSLPADCILAHEGWTIQGLQIENVHYNKKTGTYHEVNGIGVTGLAADGIVWIEDCDLADNFRGIRIEDTATSSGYAAREVDIVGCTVRDTGPLHGDPGSNDKGHQGIWVDASTSMYVNVIGSTLSNNHDGLESGNGTYNVATLYMEDTLVEECENGVEMAGGALTVRDCTFHRNGATGSCGTDPNGCGVDDPTAAIGIRGEGSVPPTVYCRSSDFTENQIAVKVSAHDGSGFSVDFGTTDAWGYNTFLTTTTSPWNSTFVSWATTANVSYCGMVNQAPGLTLEAVGNTWSYEDCSGSPPTAWNQGVQSGGMFPSGYPPIGYPTTAVNNPPHHRPLIATCGGSGPSTCCNNEPWNVSTEAGAYIEVADP